MLRQFFILVTLSTLLERVQTYPAGAPYATCFSMYPHHAEGVPEQTTEVPYTVHFSSDSFGSGDTVTIDVVANDSNRPLRGIMLGARRRTRNTEDFMGEFITYPTDKLKAFNCYGGYHNMITHCNNEPNSTISVQWRAPDQHYGDAVFWATFLENYETFWVARTYTLPTSRPDLVTVDSSYPVIPTTNLTRRTDFSSCGDTKGCILYPSHCDGHNCIAAVSYLYRPTTNDFLIEMFTKEGPNYLSLGFSSDRTMGNDFTVSCVASSGNMDVQQGKNPAYFNALQVTRSFTEREILHVDGDIHCRLGLSVQALAYSVSQENQQYEATNEPYNLNNSWYLFLAWGHSYEGSVIIDTHVERPAISLSKVNLRDTSKSYASVFPILVRVHASLMIIAWVLFTGIVTVVARHYRDWFPKRRLFGTKVWFQIHRGLAILVGLLTITGIILPFAHYGSTLRKPAGNHAKVGLAVLACVCIQIMVGLLRPNPKSSLRPLFAWAHRFSGHAAHILSAVTMFLIFDVEYITSDLREVGFITLGVWVGVQVLWHLIFEVYSYCHLRSREERSTDYNMDSRAAAESKEKERNAIIDNALIIVFILCLLASTVSIMVMFLLY